ncbi:hypothetical protein [Phormidium sp. CCY1219]|jgi:hypothetical protein|uniref:hypothetical protein n=1 Tax=Phormidium sp. CCY1219 TaxID=2886104 RepID=UPI002D1E718A|nr:hypothetical protein [Phormidium sp. CCY1219]MEB3829402.1 hypothetical protein [Phormidium sp. CCY1219]
MKTSILAASCCAISALFNFAPISTIPVSAQCVQLDQGIQVSISGAGPARRNNDVQMESQGACSGSSTVTTGAQIHVGPNRAVQNRTVRQTIRKNGHSQLRNSYPIQIRVNPQIDVDNPADRIDSINNPALRYREKLRLVE